MFVVHVPEQREDLSLPFLELLLARPERLNLALQRLQLHQRVALRNPRRPRHRVHHVLCVLRSLAAGGLGALGLLTAKVLVRHGVRRLVLLSRSGRVSNEGQDLERELQWLQEQAEVNVELMRCDVSDEASVNLITALGSSPVFAYHKAHGNAELSLIAEDDASSATCVCFAGTYGEICGNAVGGGGGDDAAGGSDNCIAFPTSGEQMGEGQPLCPEQPTSDLSAFGNPTCDVATYSGGLRCCHHLNTLLDADQPINPKTDVFRMKYRFYYEDPADKLPPFPPAPESARFRDAGNQWPETAQS